MFTLVNIINDTTLFEQGAINYFG